MAYILMILILLMVAFGQTLLKKGVQIGQAKGRGRFLSLLHPYVLMAGLMVVSSPILYVKVVAMLGLSNAFGLNALNYPIIFLFSRFFLSETSNPWHWSGLFLITMGVFVWSF